ncbi:hypothetical protein AGRO_2986 [Agrobacterium sp. ATCC 31749]|nr:hypothetical protein AGRO_2986 [Agrobacterium sp. ATCC 31749]
MRPTVVVAAKDDDRAGQGRVTAGLAGKAVVVGAAGETFIIVALQNKKRGQTAPHTGSTAGVLWYSITTKDCQICIKSKFLL